MAGMDEFEIAEFLEQKRCRPKNALIDRPVSGSTPDA